MLALLCVAIFLQLFTQFSYASPIKWRNQSFFYSAESTSLDRILKDLFIAQYGSLNISPGVKNLPPVNGELKGSAQAVFEKLQKAYGLVNYFDGTTFFVSTLNENKTFLQSLVRTDAIAVERAARAFGYDGEGFVIKKIDAPPAIQVTGPPTWLAHIRNVIAMLENGTAERRGSFRMVFRVIPLQHAWAEDFTYKSGGKDVVIKGVARSLQELVAGLSDAGAKHSSVDTDGLQRAAGLPQGGLAMLGKPVNSHKAPASLFSNFFVRDTDNPEYPPLPREVEPTLNVMASDASQVSQTRIIGDSRINAVIIMAPTDMLTMLEDVVKQLDVEPELIQIEATVMDVSGGVLDKLGVDWSLNTSRFRLGSSITGKGSGPDLADAAILHGGGANFSIFGGTAASSFLASVTALQESGNSRIHSRPKLITLNGIEAVLDSKQVFYPAVTNERFGQLYEVDVGLSMRVLPTVVRRPDGAADIRLKIFIEDGAISSTNIGALPLTTKSSISTQAIIHNGESLLIGGYVKESDVATEVKIPLLGDIPFLGVLFRYKEKNKNNNERLFLITPRLIRSKTQKDVIPLATTIDTDAKSFAGNSNTWKVAGNVSDSVPAGIVESAGETGVAADTGSATPVHTANVVSTTTLYRPGRQFSLLTLPKGVSDEG